MPRVKRNGSSVVDFAPVLGSQRRLSVSRRSPLRASTTTTESRATRVWVLSSTSPRRLVRIERTWSRPSIEAHGEVRQLRRLIRSVGEYRSSASRIQSKPLHAGLRGERLPQITCWGICSSRFFSWAVTLDSWLHPQQRGRDEHRTPPAGRKPEASRPAGSSGRRPQVKTMGDHPRLTPRPPNASPPPPRAPMSPPASGRGESSTDRRTRAIVRVTDLFLQDGGDPSGQLHDPASSDPPRARRRGAFRSALGSLPRPHATGPRGGAGLRSGPRTTPLPAPVRHSLSKESAGDGLTARDPVHRIPTTSPRRRARSPASAGPAAQAGAGRRRVPAAGGPADPNAPPRRDDRAHGPAAPRWRSQAPRSSQLPRWPVTATTPRPISRLHSSAPIPRTGSRPGCWTWSRPPSRRKSRSRPARSTRNPLAPPAAADPPLHSGKGRARCRRDYVGADRQQHQASRPSRRRRRPSAMDGEGGPGERRPGEEHGSAGIAAGAA